MYKCLLNFFYIRNLIAVVDSNNFLKGRKSYFREWHYSADIYLFGKMLFTASKSVMMGLKYPAPKMAILAPLKKRFDIWSETRVTSLV